MTSTVIWSQLHSRTSAASQEAEALSFVVLSGFGFGRGWGAVGGWGTLASELKCIGGISAAAISILPSSQVSEVLGLLAVLMY